MVSVGLLVLVLLVVMLKMMELMFLKVFMGIGKSKSSQSVKMMLVCSI